MGKRGTRVRQGGALCRADAQLEDTSEAGAHAHPL